MNTLQYDIQVIGKYRQKIPPFHIVELQPLFLLDPALSITPTGVEKVLDSKDMNVKPKTLEQIANNFIKILALLVIHGLN
ncbi:MAG TPA: hypothetical protein VFI73_08550 [Candidatus Nitrosopolaris sp.]|nr:hypothetical protein [Candidatus Nitrosopolaris sp.]